jgi:hypothetical protein
MDNIDNYAHRLSIKNGICYESAHEMLTKSIDRLNDHKYESEDIIRSAYKYSRHKLDDQSGGNNMLVPLILNIKYNY